MCIFCNFVLTSARNLSVLKQFTYMDLKVFITVSQKMTCLIGVWATVHINNENIKKDCQNPNIRSNTLWADTFARRNVRNEKNRKNFAFREHKLSRMGQKSFFREYKLLPLTFFIKKFLEENKVRKKTFTSSSMLSFQKDKYMLKFT